MSWSKTKSSSNYGNTEIEFTAATYLEGESVHLGGGGAWRKKKTLPDITQTLIKPRMKNLVYDFSSNPFRIESNLSELVKTVSGGTTLGYSQIFDKARQKISKIIVEKL